MDRNSKFTFDICATGEPGTQEIPLEAFQTLKPLTFNPREWAKPTDRGDERPRVINNALIQEMFAKYSTHTPQQRETIDSGKDVPFDEIEELKLEYLNILHIANLEKLQNLKRLSLDNNSIETLSGLGSLVMLEELDLSYNKLTTLKSIHLLIKLRVLRVNCNQLRSIELLKYNHRCLEVLDIAHNQLSDFCETLLYLSALPNLKSLALDGNPIWSIGKASEEDLKIVVFHFLPQLRFYDHRIITSFDCYPPVIEGRNDACVNADERKNLVVKTVVDRFKYEDPGMVKRLEAIRNDILAMDQNEEEAQTKLALESLLDRLCLAGLRYGKGYDTMIEKDMEGQELIGVSKKIKDEVYERLNESMMPIIIEITLSGIALFRARQVCINKYMQLWDAETVDHGECFAKRVDDFSAEEKVVREKLLKAFNADNTTEELAEKNMKEVLLYDKEFIILTKELWWDLMDKEMAVHGKLEEMFEAADEELAELVRSFVDPFKNNVVTLRKIEEDFFEYLMDFMSHYVNSMATKKTEIAKLSNHQKRIIFSSEKRNNLMTQSHDNHSFFIDIEEETAMEQLKNWLTEVAETCRRIEAENNRKEVDEINQLIVKLKSNWEDSVGEAIRTAYTFLWVVDPKWTKDVMYFKMSFEDRKIFNELESTLVRETEEAIIIRRRYEQEKIEAEEKEAEFQAQLERKLRMRRLKSLVSQKETFSQGYRPTEDGRSTIILDKSKTSDIAMKEMALLNEINLNYDQLCNAVLNEQAILRESDRKMKEREWKMEGDVEKLVHFTAGNNLKTYEQLRHKILDSGEDNPL